MMESPAERQRPSGPGQHPAGLGCHPVRYSTRLNCCQCIGPFPHRQDARVQEPRAGDENGPFWDFPGGPVGLRLHASNAGGSSSTPGWGTRSHIPRGQKKRKEPCPETSCQRLRRSENRRYKKAAKITLVLGSAIEMGMQQPHLMNYNCFFFLPYLKNTSAFSSKHN